MTQPTQNDRPPTVQEILDLTRATLDQLNDMAEKLEAFVGSRNPTDRTRRDDNREY